MKLMIKDKSLNRFEVFVCCEKCRKLIKSYIYDTEKGKIKRSDTSGIMDDVRSKLKKADLQYCYHCGEKTLKEGMND